MHGTVEPTLDEINPNSDDVEPADDLEDDDELDDDDLDEDDEE